jgi:hypothetical protein
VNQAKDVAGQEIILTAPQSQIPDLVQIKQTAGQKREDIAQNGHAAEVAEVVQQAAAVVLKPAATVVDALQKSLGEVHIDEARAAAVSDSQGEQQPQADELKSFLDALAQLQEQEPQSNDKLLPQEQNLLPLQPDAAVDKIAEPLAAVAAAGNNAISSTQEAPEVP